MIRSKWLTLPAVAACMLSAVVAVRADEPSASDLRQQMQQLQAKMDQLEAKQAAAPATSDSVMQDAAKRDNLLDAEGFTAGFTKGRFTIQDAAGNYVFRPTFQFQFRNATNWRADGPIGGTGSDTENGFEIPRAKFGFDGNAITPKLYYSFLWNASSTTGGVALEQAWARYNYADNWFVRGGQFINPTVREQSIGSRTQLAADRSQMNGLLTVAGGEARTQAIAISYDDGKTPITFEAALSDGFNSQNTDFTDRGVTATNSDFGAFGRVNYFVQGHRDDYKDFTAMGTKETLLVFGGGVDVTQNSGATSFIHTVDGQWENSKGLGVYGALLGNYTTNLNAAGDDAYSWGALVQAGYMMNEKWELFGRVDYTHLSGAALPGGVTEGIYSEFTVGTNWYISGHTKFTLDASVLPSGSSIALPNSDILASDGTEIVIRAQFQLVL